MSTTATAGAIEVLVELGDRSYPVVVGEGVRSQLGAILPSGTRRVAVVTEAGHPWLESTIEALDLPVSVHTIEGGEANKNLATIESLTSSFARAGISRADCIVGLGGGLVTDVAGFAAASYHRGLPVVHVSTTLLGQVDAAIG
ncbi:MAG: iron-containing alcohol dehydrogenase, partial [Microthrixaceae bacterium]|nr:iron-containing alcohol dehydrogenase [Microthrixaceae bacterium]